MGISLRARAYGSIVLVLGTSAAPSAFARPDEPAVAGRPATATATEEIYCQPLQEMMGADGKPTRMAFGQPIIIPSSPELVIGNTRFVFAADGSAKVFGRKGAQAKWAARPELNIPANVGNKSVWLDSFQAEDETGNHTFYIRCSNLSGTVEGALAEINRWVKDGATVGGNCDPTDPTYQFKDELPVDKVRVVSATVPIDPSDRGVMDALLGEPARKSVCDLLVLQQLSAANAGGAPAFTELDASRAASLGPKLGPAAFGAGHLFAAPAFAQLVRLGTSEGRTYVTIHGKTFEVEPKFATQWLADRADPQVLAKFQDPSCGVTAIRSQRARAAETRAQELARAALKGQARGGGQGVVRGEEFCVPVGQRLERRDGKCYFTARKAQDAFRDAFLAGTLRDGSGRGSFAPPSYDPPVFLRDTRSRRVEASAYMTRLRACYRTNPKLFDWRGMAIDSAFLREAPAPAADGASLPCEQRKWPFVGEDPGECSNYAERENRAYEVSCGSCFVMQTRGRTFSDYWLTVAETDPSSRDTFIVEDGPKRYEAGNFARGVGTGLTFNTVGTPVTYVEREKWDRVSCFPRTAEDPGQREQALEDAAYWAGWGNTGGKMVSTMVAAVVVARLMPAAGAGFTSFAAAEAEATAAALATSGSAAATGAATGFGRMTATEALNFVRAGATQMSNPAVMGANLIVTNTANGVATYIELKQKGMSDREIDAVLAESMVTDTAMTLVSMGIGGAFTKVAAARLAALANPASAPAKGLRNLAAALAGRLTDSSGKTLLTYEASQLVSNLATVAAMNCYVFDRKLDALGKTLPCITERDLVMMAGMQMVGNVGHFKPGQRGPHITQLNLLAKRMGLAVEADGRILVDGATGQPAHALADAGAPIRAAADGRVPSALADAEAPAPRAPPGGADADPTLAARASTADEAQLIQKVESTKLTAQQIAAFEIDPTYGPLRTLADAGGRKHWPTVRKLLHVLETSAEAAAGVVTRNGKKLLGGDEAKYREWLARLRKKLLGDMEPALVACRARS